MLILLSIFQSIFGTIRLYNASEQSYENLSTKKTYTTDTAPKNAATKVTKKENSEDIIFYLVENKQAIQSALKEMPPEKAKKVTEKTESLEDTMQKTISEPEKKAKSDEKFTSPVEITVTPETSSAPKWYTETLWTVVTGAYFRDALWKFSIIVDTSRVEPRWQMYNESITLSSRISNLPEVSKVLVHEIAHMIDIYTLKKKLKKADPSEEFYAISWVKPSIMKAWLSGSSFVSGYASTNQYEDFAESFTMYVFHNKEFLKRAQGNTLIQKKYTFLKSRIFWNVFIGSAYEKDVIPKKVWDITKISIKETNLIKIFAWVRAYAG